MSPFANPARIRIVNECFIKNWIQNPINRMVQKSVANRGFVDCSLFWIRNIKSFIACVAIAEIGKIIMKSYNIR